MQIDVKQLEALVLEFGTSSLIGLLILFVGFKISNLIVKYFVKFLDRKNIDVSLKPFLASIVKWTLKISVTLAAINTAGIKTTSFLAILGSAGLAVGLALKGSLANFAGGVLILILRPFKVGDFITASGHTGTVHEITVFYTILKTGDNKFIYVPNGDLSNSAIINVNHEPTRRVDFVFGVSYSDDLDLAKNIVRSILETDQRVHDDPAVFVVVSELADSSVNITARAWVDTANYWGVFFDTTENVKKEFDKNGISIPFPQTDVHFYPVN